jgi:23S rRNA (cytosine1962-C5)-methyltransferase
VADVSLRLHLAAAAETAVRGGHPWVFAESVRDQNRAGEPGEIAVLYDRRDRFLALGLFDPDSPLRVRVLHRGKPQTINSAWWRERFKQAITRRNGLFDADTNGYRWINGESDGWPALVLDRYADTLVLKLYSAAWFPRLGEVIQLIHDELDPARLVLRLSRNIQSLAANRGAPGDGSVLFGESVETPVVFTETGLQFEADVIRGQKTGFFLDQRENRRIVETFSAGAEVLNAFSFSGGFSVYAARGGAKSVTDLDISRHALESAKRNFTLNTAHARVRSCVRREIQADAFDWLAGNPKSLFDLIVLDPPSLAKREGERARAIRAYGRLAQNAVAHLRPRGVLVAASCSAHVTADEFFSAVQRAAKLSRRRFEVVRTTRHARDHPATFPEAEYLKCIDLRLAD